MLQGFLRDEHGVRSELRNWASARRTRAKRSFMLINNTNKVSKAKRLVESERKSLKQLSANSFFLEILNLNFAQDFAVFFFGETGASDCLLRVLFSRRKTEINLCNSIGCETSSWWQVIFLHEIRASRCYIKKRSLMSNRFEGIYVF